MITEDYPNEIILTINVTRDDIDNGLRKDSENCPIALAGARAVKALFGEAFEEIIVESNIVFTIDGWHYVQQNPISEISKFTKAFDEEDYVSPIELEVRFEIEVTKFDDEYGYEE